MEGIFMGKIVGSCSHISEEDGKRCASIYFHDTESNACSKLSHYNKTYSLVLSDDVIKTNDEILKLRDEVKRLTEACNGWEDKCNDWKKRYAKANNELFQKGLAYGTLEGAYKNEKIAGELLLKDRDILKEDRDRWKNRWNSVVTDIGESLKANGIEFKLKEIHGEGNWDVVIDIPELNEAKKKVEDLEKKLKAAKFNETFWRGRKEEMEAYHHYWLNTYDRVVKQAADKGIHIGVCGNDEKCNAGVVVVNNVKAEELEKRVVALEETNNNLNQKIGAADNALEYWNNTYKGIVDAGKEVGVKIEIKGKKSDSNAGFVYVTNEKAEELESQIVHQDKNAEYWFNTFYEAVDQAKELGIDITASGFYKKENVAFVEVKNKKAEELEKALAKDRSYHWKRNYEILTEYWDNTYKEIVATGKEVGVKIEIKGKKSDSNAGFVYVTNEKTIELMVKLSDMKQKQDRKWSAMTEALKDKGVEVIYMGEEDEKPIIDVKVPEIDILKKELEALKSRTLDNVEIRLSCGDIVWTYCDGFVHVSSGISGMISADEISTGTVPKCSSCVHYMHNHSRFAHDWCYRPVPKEGGAGYIRKLNKEESEGPACSDYKARKE